MNNITVAVQKKSAEKIVKRSFLNVDAFLKIHFEQKQNDGYAGTYARVTDELVRWMDVPEEVLWTAAMQNTQELIKVIPMGTFFQNEEIIKKDILWVVTFTNLSDGAAAILFPNIFREFCEKRGENSCLILPSSTQEVIILPESQNAVWDPIVYAWLVDSTNKSQVDPLIQLDAVVYQYTLETDSIEIFAEA